MDRNFENSYANDSQRSFNYNTNDDLGQRQLNYDEESSFPDLSAMLEREVSQANDLRQQVDAEAAQSLTLLESKDKSYLYETPQFYLLWEWKPNNSSKQILALRKSPEQGVISLANARSQKWENYFPNEMSQAKIIVEASKNAPLRGQLSSELYGEIERLFSIDLSQVVFVRNSAKATQLKARAVTIGQEIHFAPNEWNEENESFITLLAHELAHIYQNKQNRVGATNMLGNQPINDDPRMEAEADQAAEATKKGRRFNFGKFKSGDNDLMKQFAQRKVAQRMALKTNWGTFEITDHNPLINAPTLDTAINFIPDQNKVDSTKIGFVQTVQVTEQNTPIASDPTSRERMTANGERIDRMPSTENNPIYGTEGLSDKLDISESTSAESTLVLGHNFKNAAGQLESQNAKMKDTPTVVRNNTRETIFETTALALGGNQKDQYYGSITWGYTVDSGAAWSNKPDVKDAGSVSNDFIDAAKTWNNSKTRGTLTTNKNAKAVECNDKGEFNYNSKLLTISVGQILLQIKPFFIDKGFITGNNKWIGIRAQCIIVKDETLFPSLGYGIVLVDDVTDAKDGEDVAKLPIPPSVNTNSLESPVNINPTSTLETTDNNEETNTPDITATLKTSLVNEKAVNNPETATITLEKETLVETDKTSSLITPLEGKHQGENFELARLELPKEEILKIDNTQL